MEFLKGAKDFARNPLGIVALFISLIYGFASLLLNSSVEKLTENERWPLIMFIVLFPVLVLITFYRLVTNHHGKLYAPGDYKDDKSFLRTLSPEEQELKLEKEVKESLSGMKESCDTDSKPKQKPSSNKSSIDERAKRREEHQLFKQDLELVEDTIIKSLNREFKTHATRNIGIGDSDVIFDAHLSSVHKNQFLFAEVKAIKSVIPPTSMLDRVLYNAVVADKFFESNFKLIFTVVYYFDESKLSRIEDYWNRKVSQCPANVELRFISRKSLDIA